jgi:hypothetical protein
MTNKLIYSFNDKGNFALENKLGVFFHSFRFLVLSFLMHSHE